MFRSQPSSDSRILSRLRPATPVAHNHRIVYPAAHSDMTTVEHPPRHIHFSNQYSSKPSTTSIPLLTTSAPDSSDSSPDPMDTGSDNAARDSQNASPRGDKQAGSSAEHDNQASGRNGNAGQHAVGAAAAAQQPKAISAAFIHKLYR